MAPKKFGARCLVVTLFLVLLAIPVSASAALTESQISAIAGLLSSFNASATTVSEIRSILRGQIPPAGTGERLKLLRTLTAGMSGEDVRRLQRYLITKGYLAPGSDTGHFGLLTQAGVRQFQAARGLVSSGTPATTGWGSVGPRTRAVLEESSVPGTKPPTPTTKPPSSSLSCATPGLTPLYELFEPRTKKHFYTTSESEQRRFISDLGYADRGVVAYVYDREMSGTAPLQRFKSDSTEDRIYTTKPDTAKLNSEGYRFEKIEGHLYTTQESGSLPFAQYSFVGQQDHWYSIDETLATTFASLGAVSEGAQGYACPGAPHISDNTILSLAGATTVISGLGFADNSANPFRDDYVVTFVGGGNTITISSLDSRVLMWNSRTIKLRTPSGL
ncbi:MAG TPA: peptidoglycan-binding protein, partial [Candidatus Paceibacterota bacterium]